MITAILFDYGGVFTKGSIKKGADRIAQQCQKDVRAFHSLIGELWNKAKVEAIPAEQFWAQSAAYVQMPVEEFKSKLMSQITLQEEMFALAKSLKPHYKLGLLTNNIRDWFEETRARNNLGELFNTIVTSYEERIAKPDQNIYLLAAQRLSAWPKECIFIDDQIENILAAEAIGMKGIHCKSAPQVKRKLKRLGILW